MSDTGSSSPQPAQPRRVMTSDVYLEGKAGLRVYSDAIAETSEVSPLGDPACFQVRSLVHHLGGAVLTDVQSSSVRYRRSARHVARAAYDHYQITVNLTADILNESGRQSVTQRPGDILILDSARTTHSYIQAPGHGVTRTPAIFIPARGDSTAAQRSRRSAFPADQARESAGKVADRSPDAHARDDRGRP